MARLPAATPWLGEIKRPFISSFFHPAGHLQGLSDAAGSEVRISFTPHLMPMSRGMQSTIYIRLANGASVDDLRSHLQASLVAPPPSQM